MNEEVFAQEEDFQPYLLENHYTFVGPEDGGLLEKFVKIANEVAPPNVFHTIHNVLSNSIATKKALEFFPPDTHLRVYVIIPNNDTFLFHLTIDDYCKSYNVEYSKN